MRGEGEWEWAGVSGDELVVPLLLLRVLLLREDSQGEGVLQCQRENILRRGLHGEIFLKQPYTIMHIAETINSHLRAKAL